MPVLASTHCDEVQHTSNPRRATRILFWVIVVMGGLVVAHTAAWAVYRRNGWRLPRLLPFPRLEVYFAMFMLAPMATCAGRASRWCKMSTLHSIVHTHARMQPANLTRAMGPNT